MNRRTFLQLTAAAGFAAAAGSGSVQAADLPGDSAPAFWKLAATPPMGWNSYDYYGATVTEAQYLANAEYMQKHLLPCGYRYAIIDYLWFDPTQATRGVWQHGPLAMDKFGRLLPALNKFPSARGGVGFKPLAEKIHAMGLIFGFHIMRGIPRQAVAANTPIEGSTYTARDAANVHDMCSWNNDMYGVRGDTPAGQAYFDSLIRLYSSWGTQFIKVDDLSHPYHKAEIHAIRRALNKYGPGIVFSTSPGPTPVSEGADIEHNANMWRIRNDFWDSWAILNNMIDLVAAWKGFGGPGHWPDCDMICLGHIGKDAVGGLRMTHFTMDEQRTMMTLWGIAPSPLFLGMDLTKMDPWTLSLIANPEMLAINQDPLGAQGIRISQHGPLESWTKKLHNGDLAMALFNRGGQNAVPVTAAWTGVGSSDRAVVRDVWNQRTLGEFNGRITLPVASHGAQLLRISPPA